MYHSYTDRANNFYKEGDRKTMLINKTWQLQTNPHSKELAAWDGVREQ
jgi:para-nitrobenzyl esterase